MASGSYHQVNVECPFYQRDDGEHRITCEGVLDNSTLTMGLKRRDFDMYIREYCSKRYICCEVYRMLMDKYEEK